jgi:hypothetical protein
MSITDAAACAMTSSSLAASSAPLLSSSLASARPKNRSVLVGAFSGATGGLRVVSNCTPQEAVALEKECSQKVTKPLEELFQKISATFEAASFKKTSDATGLRQKEVASHVTTLSSIASALESHFSNISGVIEADQMPKIMKDATDARVTLRALERTCKRMQAFCNAAPYTQAVELLRSVETNIKKYQSAQGATLLQNLVEFTCELGCFQEGFTKALQGIAQDTPSTDDATKKNNLYQKQELLKIKLQALGLFSSVCTKLLGLATEERVTESLKKELLSKCSDEKTKGFLETLRQKDSSLQDLSAFDGKTIPDATLTAYSTKISGHPHFLILGLNQEVTTLRQQLEGNEKTRTKIHASAAQAITDDALNTYMAGAGNMSNLPATYYQLPENKGYMLSMASYISNSFDCTFNQSLTHPLQAVTKGIWRLFDDIQKCAKKVFAGEVPEKLQDEVDRYRDLCVALEKRLTKLADDVHKSYPDGYSVAVEQHITGLFAKLEDLRRALGYLYTLCSKEYQEITKAQKAMNRFLLTQKKGHVYTSLSSLQAIEDLYIAASRIGPYRDKCKTTPPTKSHQKATLQQANMLNDVLIKKGEHIVTTLVGGEGEVWDLLTGMQAIKMLKEQDEKNAQTLPTAVLAFIEKKIYGYFYRSKTKNDDFELELVLHILRNSKAYKPLYDKTFQENKHFAEVVGAYEANAEVKKRRLSDDVLKDATNICKKLYFASGVGFLDYAEALQAFDAFQVKNGLANVGGDKTEPLDELQAFLFNYLNDVATESEFVALAQTRHLFVIGSDEAFDPKKHRLQNLATLTGLDKFTEQIKDTTLYPQDVQKGLFVRALACARWGVEKLHPVVDAHKIVRLFLEDDALRKELLKDKDLQALVAENTLHKALNRRHDLIGQNELDLFIQGSVTNYLKEGRHLVFDTRIDCALFNIVQNEKTATTIRDLVRTSMTEKTSDDDTFDRWLDGHLQHIAAHQPQFEAF